MVLYNVGEIAFENSDITNNTAGFGGGGYLYNVGVVLDGGAVTGNGASNGRFGEAIALDGDTAAIGNWIDGDVGEIEFLSLSAALILV